MRTSLIFSAFLLVSMFGLANGLASLQPPQDPTKQAAQDSKSVLGERQRLVERKMAELESRFTAIAEQLREKEPERADRLVAAYQRAKETLLTERMNRVSQLLDQGQTGQAQLLLDEVILSLEELVKMLVDTRGPQLDRQQEIKMLEEWKKEIRAVQQEQKKERRETENVANKEDALKRLDAQIKELNNLIEAQKEVREQTQGAASGGLRALDKVADEQFELRKKTEDLLRDIAGDSDIEQPKGDGAEPPKSDNPQSDDSKQADSKQGDTPTGDAKQGDSKQGDAKQGDAKQGEPQSGEPPSGDPKSSPPPSESSKSPAAGQKPLEQAQESQRRAEEKLASGKPLDAERQQDKAIDDMEKALLELEKEKRRIASLPPEALQQIAQNQRRLRDKSMEIAKQMRDAPKPKPNPDSESSTGDQPQKQPGQQSMDDAGQSMQKAANDLNEDDSEQAQKNQKEAEKKLQQALDDIEERLNQLREETREEKLARLEARFREMLDRQKIASLMTIELNDKRTSFDRLEQRDRLVLMRLATEETEINEIGQQAYDLLLEDGTSVVFPEIVHYLKADLLRAGQLLTTERTDQLTQIVQRDIESNLEELLDALKKAKKKGGGGGGGGGGGKQPLLEKSAELKMLRAAQLRLNRRTKQFDSLKSERGLDSELKTEIDNLSRLQKQLFEMAERIMSAEEGDE